eukprot:1609397-Pleurochrysis_carterae.AAC.1
MFGCRSPVAATSVARNIYYYLRRKLTMEASCPFVEWPGTCCRRMKRPIGNEGCEQPPQPQPASNSEETPGSTSTKGAEEKGSAEQAKNHGKGDGEEEGPKPAPAATLPFAEGARVQMNFASPSNPSWYGGVVGAVSAGGAHVGFDDGELRFFPTEEAAG